MSKWNTYETTSVNAKKKIIARPLAIKTLKRCIKLFLPFTSVKKVHVLSTIPGKVFGTK